MGADDAGPRSVVVIGASAGGLKALVDLVGELPSMLNAPLIIAMHSSPTSRLSKVLGSKCGREVHVLEDGMSLDTGEIFVVPPARHAFFRRGRIQLSEPVENSGFRPSIDALFMTAASEYGSGTIAVVLSGTLNDGMRGAQIVYDMGGRTIVQDPAQAEHAGMPRSVIRADHPAAILEAKELGEWITSQING